MDESKLTWANQWANMKNGQILRGIFQLLVLYQVLQNLVYQIFVRYINMQIYLYFHLLYICIHGRFWEHNNGSNWISTFQMRPFSHFQPILQLDLRWPLTLVHDLWLHEHMKVHIYQQTKFGSNRTSTFLNETIFTFSAYLTTWPQMTFDVDIWPLTSSTFVEIHQSMWKIEPNVNPFSQQTTKTKATDNSGQSDPYVSFLLRQATQKWSCLCYIQHDTHSCLNTITLFFESLT